MPADYTGPSSRRAACLLPTARARRRHRRVRRLGGTGEVGGLARVNLCARWCWWWWLGLGSNADDFCVGFGWLIEEASGRMRPTLARQEERLPASWRARSRRRSYSASVELDGGWWLNAIWCSRWLVRNRIYQGR